MKGEIRRALSILDDHLKRTAPVYDRRREYRRRPVYRRLLVLPAEERDRTPIEAWTYEISRSGLGFVCETKFSLTNVMVCFDVDGTSHIWMHASVKHCKEVMDYVDACGVHFQMRANLPG